jgi:hypothetical protein
MNKLEILKNWETAVKASLEYLETLDCLCLEPESPLYATFHTQIDAYTRQVAHDVEDKADWLSWYMYENDMGKRAGEVSWKDATGRRFRVSVADVETLLLVIEN